MRKIALIAGVALLSLGALAFEKYMIRVPDELNPKEGIKGVTTYFFAPAAVSIPLKDGNWIYLVNETPKQESEGGPAQIGVPKKIVELDVVSLPHGDGRVMKAGKYHEVKPKRRVRERWQRRTEPLNRDGLTA